MTSRERNLLILLATMAFVAVNLLGYKLWYQPRMAALEAARTSAETQATTNESSGNVLQARQKDLDWLNRYEPKPTSLGKMKTSIQQLADREASRANLETLGRPKFGDDLVDPSLNYHRVRYEIEVQGTESAIYRWLDRIHKPNEFRAVTYVRLSPQRDNAKRADCEIFLDQWFVPEGDPS